MPKSSPRSMKIAAVVGSLAVFLAASLGVMLQSNSSKPSGRHAAFVDSRYPNVDPTNSRHATGPIRSGNVAELHVAWRLPIGKGKGLSEQYDASPVVADGVAYSQNLSSDVQAIDLETGRVLWERRFGSRSSGPNGVTVIEGKVFGATPRFAFALNRKTGKELWRRTLVRSDNEQITMAPGYRQGLVIFSTMPAKFKGGEVGVLWALNAWTGKPLWKFDTVPRALWGNPEVNYGGGASYVPAFDGPGGLYVGVGNAGPIPGTERQPWGSSRPGPNHYSNSIVKLDGATGAIRWFHQVTPHGLCNWDVGAPLLVRKGNLDLVIAAGLSGQVVAVDRRTGRLVWQRAVGIHNGHDDDGVVAMRGEYSKLRTPMTVYPGSLGGVFGPMSTSGSLLYVPVVNAATRLVTHTKAKSVGPARGEIVALDLSNGAVKWKRRLPWPVFAPTTAVNDLVFAETADGTVYGFERSSGRQVWKASLPAGSTAGIVISGDTLLAPAGLAGRGETPELVAYRLSR